MRKRRCKHCSSEIYLQYIPVTSSIKWVSFDVTDGRLHSCPNKPLDCRTRNLIQEAVDRMNYNTAFPKEEIVHSIDMIIESLKQLRLDVTNYHRY